MLFSQFRQRFRVLMPEPAAGQDGEVDDRQVGRHTYCPLSPELSSG